MTLTIVRRCAAAGTLIVLAASLAEAQVLAGSFDRLPLTLRLGDAVRVTDVSGREILGRVSNLSPTSLSLLVDGAERDVSENSVLSISRKVNGSVRTGALWGLGVGAGLGTLMGVALSGECYNGCGAMVPLVAAMYGGIGSGIGAGISALTTHQEAIYFRRSGASSRLTVSPTVTPQRRGVVMSLGL